MKDQWVKALLEKLGIGNTLTPRWSYPPKRTTQLYYEAFHKSPRLDALYMLAGDVASAQFKLYDKNKYKADPENADPLRDHPIYDVLDNPMPEHKELDGYALSLITEVYVNLIGEAFWVVERDARGVPREIYPIPPNWVLTTPTTNVNYYFIVPLGNTSHKPLPVMPEDVIWFKEPDITSPFGRGRARTESIGDELEADEFAAKYGKNYFYNDATPPLLITLPNATQVQADSFLERWMQKVGGYLNARKPAVTNVPNASVTKLADSVREMDFVESRKFLRDVCNQHWSLPPELMGILENSNRSTIDSAYYLWTKNVVSKRIARKEAALNRQLVPMYDKNVVLKYDNVVPQDDEYDLKVASQGVTLGTVTVDEWRHAQKMAPLPNGRGDVLLRPFNVAEVSVTARAAIDEEPAPKPDAMVTEPVKEEPKLVAAEGALVPDVPPVKRVKAFNADQRKAIWKSFDAKAASGEQGFIKIVRKISAAQSAEVSATYKALIKDHPIEDAVKMTLDKCFGDNADKYVKDNLAPAWLTSMKQGFDQAAELLGGGLDFGIVNPEFVKWIRINGLLKAKGINDTTNEKLRNKIAQSLGDGIDSGESMSKLSARVLDATDGVYEEMDNVRSMLIARTETMASVNFGAVETYRSDGVEQKEWLATQDDRTRDDHIDADGQIVAIDEDFSVGGDTMDAPGNGSDPAENCNCRCTVLPVISEEGD